MNAECGEKVSRIPVRNFLSIPEVARARGVSRVTVLNDIRAGKLRAEQDGSRRWWVHVRDVDAYLKIPVRGRSS